MAVALDIIGREHRSLGTILFVLDRLAGDLVEQTDSSVDLRVFHAILNYIDAFLDRYHHPKEDDWLFAALLRRVPESAATIAALKEEHRDGAALYRRLRAALADCEVRGRPAWAEFRDVVREYVEFERRHAAREEREILPLARDRLSAEDWRAIDAAFADHRDPLFGERPRAEFEELRRVITRLAPQPYGFGPAWNAGA